MSGFRKRLESVPEQIDRLFAYDTVKLVRVLDCRLGVFNTVSTLGILVYVIVYVFAVSRKYQEEEKVQGWVVVETRGAQYSDTGVPWDLYDRIFNPGEQGAVFVPTRVLITRGQTQEDEYCESPLHKCSVPLDCDIRHDIAQKAECVNGHCMRRQWCPAEDPSSATTERHYLEFDQVEVNFQTSTHFHKFQIYVTTSDEEQWALYPDPHANAFLLRDLVKWSGLEPADVMENGAVMEVNLKLDSPMVLGKERTVHQEIESHDIDTVTGYNVVHNEFYFEKGIRKRDTYRMFGIRLMAFATGFAERWSSSGIVIQISSAFALMGWAEWLTDIFLMHVVPERRHYTSVRIKQTEDFNPD